MNYRNKNQGFPFYLLIFCSLICTTVWAQDATFSTGMDQLDSSVEVDAIKNAQQDSFEHEFKWGIDALPFHRISAFAEEEGSINPRNRVAQLSKLDFGLYLRPAFNYRLRKNRELLSVWIKPRLNLDFPIDRGLSEDEDQFEAAFFFQEFKAKWQISENIFLLGGRYLKETGTSIFINPSNPFLPNPFRLNPKFEQRPMDFVELNFTTQTDWDFSLISNVYQAQNPNYEFPLFDFSRSYALQGEYYGDSENLGAIFSIDENRKYHLGFYGQKNIGEAIVAWVDASLTYNINRFYPVDGHWTDPELLEFDMINGDKNDEVFPVALIGASYTTNLGPTVQLEYLYNGQGFNDEEYDMLNEVIASSAIYNFDITKDLSNINLARAINPGMPYMRRHYVFTQVNQNDVWDQFNYNLRYIFSIEDQSHQASALLEWNVGAFEFFSVMLFNFGGRDTDLNRLLDSQLMFGATYSIF